MADKKLSDVDTELSQVSKRGQEIISIVKQLVSQVSKGKDEVEPLLAAGKIREIEQIFPLAKRDYLAILKAYPTALEAQARLALVSLKMGNLAEGLAIARQLVDENKDFRFKDISGRPTSALTVLGDAYRLNGDLHQAKRAYQGAIELQPNDSYSAGKLAQILLNENNVNEASALVDRFLDDTELESFKTTIRLLNKDVNRLPAIKGVIENRSVIFRDVA